MLKIKDTAEMSRNRNDLIERAKMTFSIPFVCKEEDGATVESVKSVYGFNFVPQNAEVIGIGFDNVFNELMYYTLKKVTEDETDFSIGEEREAYYYGVDSYEAMERANSDVPDTYRFKVMTDAEAKRIVKTHKFSELMNISGCDDMLPRYQDILKLCYSIINNL